MKKITVSIIAALMILSITACGTVNDTASNSEPVSSAESKSEVSVTSESQTEESSTSSSELDKTTDTANSSEKTDSVISSEVSEASAPSSSTEETDTLSDSANEKALVVYYSATGSTKAVAGYISGAIGADSFELVPVNEYTEEDLNWTDENSRVVREHDNPDERNVELVSDTVENWDEYDTVYIGYPIWWGIAAWPVDNFVKNNDFSGKTVIPFCTSASSGLGESGELLAEMAGSGNWLEGERFSSGASEDTVAEWVSGLNLGE